jgi:PAS domain S-box-containing protein
MNKKITPSSHEIVMRDDDFIVSKTDPKGIITYCNQIFIEFSGYTERELLGKQHNIVRHPDMPRTVFALLWQTIRSGEEFIGYVKNMSKDGSYYWVFATVTPCFITRSKEIIGFSSVRRKPDKAKVQMIEALYLTVLEAERKVSRNVAVESGTAVFQNALQATGKDYREYILTL